MTGSDGATYFQAVDADECGKLLKSAQVGRIAWGGPDDIQVLPVNFRLVDGAVVFHTRSGTPLAALAQPTPAVFEVDETDADAAVGWSVVARGTTRPSTVAGSGSWVPDNRDVAIELVIESLSGRVVSGHPTGGL